MNSLKKLIASTGYPIFAATLFAGITIAAVKTDSTDLLGNERGLVAGQCASGAAEWLELDAYQCDTNPWERGLKIERYLECVWKDLTNDEDARSRRISKEESHNRAIQYFRNRGVTIISFQEHIPKDLLCAMLCSEPCGVYKVLVCSGSLANKKMLGFRPFGTAYQKIGLDVDGRSIK